jgi:hypothetical protein
MLHIKVTFLEIFPAADESPAAGNVDLIIYQLLLDLNTVEATASTHHVANRLNRVIAGNRAAQSSPAHIVQV